MARLLLLLFLTSSCSTLTEGWSVFVARLDQDEEFTFTGDGPHSRDASYSVGDGMIYGVSKSFGNHSKALTARDIMLREELEELREELDQHRQAQYEASQYGGDEAGDDAPEEEPALVVDPVIHRRWWEDYAQVQNLIIFILGGLGLWGAQKGAKKLKKNGA